MRARTNESADPVAAISAVARPLARDEDVFLILKDIGDAKIVLLGEATHGTHEFYEWRALITRRLIEQHGFSAVAIEGDWPDAYQVNRFVQGDDTAGDAVHALSGFERFPVWMWRNTAVAEFVRWLRMHNLTIGERRQRVGVYGLDLYSLHASMRAVVQYLEQRDPVAAREAKASYACFEDFGEDTDRYAWAAGRLGEESCAEAVARELIALQQKRSELLRVDDDLDAFFSAEQNARLAHNAERYYRLMTQGRVASWNLRDEHMAETLEALLVHLHRRTQPAKVVVWAHNSHLGDARATEMGRAGELNLGQLVREKHGNAAHLIGLTTYSGTVMAANDWGEPGRIRRVRPALGRSVELLFHLAGIPRFYLPLHAGTDVHRALSETYLERAIGVIYRPESERMSHYFDTRVAEQFDAILHFDETRAVEPLESTAMWDPSEAPETYPSGV
jgi:erythromycin esterase-like protein